MEVFCLTHEPSYSVHEKLIEILIMKIGLIQKATQKFPLKLLD